MYDLSNKSFHALFTVCVNRLPREILKGKRVRRGRPNFCRGPSEFLGDWKVDRPSSNFRTRAGTVFHRGLPRERPGKRIPPALVGLQAYIVLLPLKPSSVRLVKVKGRFSRGVENSFFLVFCVFRVVKSVSYVFGHSDCKPGGLRIPFLTKVHFLMPRLRC